jgi:hypothetical protein
MKSTAATQTLLLFELSATFLTAQYPRLRIKDIMKNINTAFFLAALCFTTLGTRLSAMERTPARETAYYAVYRKNTNDNLDLLIKTIKQQGDVQLKEVLPFVEDIFSTASWNKTIQEHPEFYKNMIASEKALDDAKKVQELRAYFNMRMNDNKNESLDSIACHMRTVSKCLFSPANRSPETKLLWQDIFISTFR